MHGIPTKGLWLICSLELNNKEEWVSARTKSAAYLDEHPDSMVGHMVMGRALWLGEGQHSRAMHALNLAYQHHLERYNTAEPPWKLCPRFYTRCNPSLETWGSLNESWSSLHSTISFRMSLTCALRNPIPDSLVSVVAAHSFELYDEARLAARQAIETGRRWQVSLGHNVLCAVEAEERRRA